MSLNLLTQVDAGEMDMAVIIRPPFSLPAEMQWRPLVAEPYVLLVPASRRRVPWRELIEAQPFIRYDRRSFGDRQVDAFLRKQRIDLREAIEVDEPHGIAQMVARRLGVGLSPVSDGGGAWPPGVVALDLDDDTFHREIGLVERSRRGRQDAATQLADCIVDAAGRLHRGTRTRPRHTKRKNTA